MSSVSSQPQFRYTQPPSKVLHLRNLPWECTEEELIELGKPFGKVVNTKCNVGANRNQAFIEFQELNQAIAMISYYASSSEPAQVRGKTVYLQYSNRQEIVNNKTTADVAGNVLLVTIEGNDARLVSIDVLHLVFSAFGFVHKITTFEKTAGFQALVQFSDAETATAAKDSLDGRSIPRYLIPELGPCSLKITYSAHTDLSVKFQSHRSRDYTNPMLPVAPSAIDASGQISVGLDGKKLEPESNVLLASIENMQYAVTLDVLHMVFSAFGPILKIAMFDKNGGVQALIQYPDVQTAVAAKEALEGHSIYEGGFCKLHISYSRHTDLSIKGGRFSISANEVCEVSHFTATTVVGIVDELKDKLTDIQLKMFRDTYFGHFLDLPKVHIQRQLFRHLMMKEIISNEPEKFITMVNGVRLCFGLQEFAIMTGLNCYGEDLDVVTDSPNRLICTYFKGYNNVPKSELVSLFHKKGWTGDDNAVKIAVLYFIQTCVLSASNLKTFVPKEHFDLVESGAYQHYPWGRAPFNELIKTVRHKFKPLGKFYRLGGLPLALQVWFYECWSVVDKSLAIRVDYSVRVPRMLTWKVIDKKPRFNNLAKGIFCSTGNTVVFFNISPTDDR